MDPVRPRKLFDPTIGVRGAVSVSVFLAPFFGLAALGCSGSSSLASGHFFGGLGWHGGHMCEHMMQSGSLRNRERKAHLLRLLRELSRIYFSHESSRIVKSISMTTFPP